MYRRKTSIKIDLEHLICRHFWTSTMKACIFNGKFFAGLSNLLCTCPEDYLQSNVSERKSWKLKDFWINFEVFGTMAENLFQGCQNSKRCSGKNLLKNVFKREKFIIFFRFLVFFYFEWKNSIEGRNPQITYPWKIFEETFCENL